jgi:hypothetical protein
VFLLRSRHPDALTCLLLFVAGGFVMSAMAAGWWSRYGRPSRWPVRVLVGTAAVALAACAGWWWVNGAVEGPIVVPLTHRHAITAADLLALPALAWAAYLSLLALRCEVGSRRSRRGGRDHETSRS